MSIKTYQFFCDNCGYKRFSKGNDIQDLNQVAQSSIPRGTPYYDPISKKTIVPPPIKRQKVFKCPTCGYTIKANKLKEIENEQTDRLDGREDGTKGPSIPGDFT